MAYDIYPYTNLHDLNLDWALAELKRSISMVEQNAQAQADLKQYVDTWVEQQDIPAEVAAEIQAMADDGRLTELLGDSLTTLLSNRKGRRWLFISDSYANRTGDWDDTIVLDWGLDRCNLAQGGTYDENTNCFTIRKGGYGFVGVTTSDPDIGGNWLDLCRQYWPADVDKSTITDIVIVGGYNDRAEYTQANLTALKSAMTDFKTGFADLFPNAHVWVVECGMHVVAPTQRQKIVTAYMAYKDAAAIGPNWSFIKGPEGILHCLGHVDRTGDDYHHPNVDGSAMLAHYLECALQGLECPPILFTGVLGGGYPRIKGEIDTEYVNYYDPDTCTVTLYFFNGNADLRFWVGGNSPAPSDITSSAIIEIGLYETPGRSSSIKNFLAPTSYANAPWQWFDVYGLTSNGLKYGRIKAKIFVSNNNSIDAEHSDIGLDYTFVLGSAYLVINLSNNYYHDAFTDIRDLFIGTHVIQQYIFD